MSTKYYGTEAVITFVPMTCPVQGCGVVYALTERYQEKRREDGHSWCCPNGHYLSYSSKIQTEKARAEAAEARNLALRDQLEASAREAELIRQALLRDRHRFANGVCPCCNRSFEDVRRHMTTKHPNYDVTTVAAAPSREKFTCSCGSTFYSLHGLRVHQGRNRTDGWERPDTPTWRAHLTTV